MGCVMQVGPQALNVARNAVLTAGWPESVPGTKDFPAGTYLVEAGQPKGVAVQMLLEPSPTLEDTSFYDLSGWSLPPIYNLEAYQLSEIPRVDRVPVVIPPRRSGGVSGEPAQYSYAIPYEGLSALFAAVDLLNRGILVSVANDEFTANGHEFIQGTFVIPLRRNHENLRQILEEVTKALAPG